MPADPGAIFIFQTPCTLDLDLSYSNEAVTVDYRIRTVEPVTWSTWLIGGDGVKRLWNQSLPVIEGPRTGTVTIPGIAPAGTVGLLSTFAAAGSAGLSCWAYETLETGGAGPTAEEVRGIAERSGLTIPWH